MQELFSFIFGDMDISVLTPAALVCIYMFSILLESVGGIFYSVTNMGRGV